MHVHVITNKRIDVNECRKFAKQAHWGGIHVERIPRARASYLAKYLSKERPEALREWRLWAGFGKAWEWSKVSNIQTSSLLSAVYRGLAETFKWKGNKGFKERMHMAEAVAELTVLEGWKPGLGPEDAPYTKSMIRILLGPGWRFMRLRRTADKAREPFE